MLQPFGRYRPSTESPKGGFGAEGAQSRRACVVSCCSTYLIALLYCPTPSSLLSAFVMIDACTLEPSSLLPFFASRSPSNSFSSLSQRESLQQEFRPSAPPVSPRVLYLNEAVHEPFSQLSLPFERAQLTPSASLQPNSD